MSNDPAWVREYEERTNPQMRTTAQLSSHERSLVNDRMIEQIGNLTAANNELNARLTSLKTDYDGHIAWHTQQSKRSLWQRLRWLVTGK